MAKVIMVQGTMSGVGKSFLVAGLCRIFKQDGYKAAPFKSQNMALNSYITDEGLEMGRAQVLEAEAAGIKPMVCMNPILLKPTDSIGSQVIVNGEILGQMSARDYFAYKKQLVPCIKDAFRELEKYADIIVIEGAGSPAEINLKENDIVNMGMAEMVDAPVLLVGDIDRGGVFAQLLGTVMLLTDEEKDRIKGLIINKFRGDKTILDPGIVMLEERGSIPVAGVLPYRDVRLEDEDSLSERFDNKNRGLIDIAVVRFPRISNFTDFNVFEQNPMVSVRYVISPAELEKADMIILPGSKNTIGDLKWMRQNGIEAMIKKMSEKVPVFGICGGFQMLGNLISDPDNIEEGGSIKGIGLLNIETVLKKEKVRSQTTGKINKLDGFFSDLSDLDFEGYEIHVGETVTSNSNCSEDDRSDVNSAAGCSNNANIDADCSVKESIDPVGAKNIVLSNQTGMVYGTYVHGIFDKKEIAEAVIKTLADKKGVAAGDEKLLDYATFKEKEYDKMADILREHLDMKKIYGMLKEAEIQ